MNATRAFYEDDVARPQIFYQPLAGGIGVAKEDRGHSAGTGGSGQVLGIALNCDHEIEAGLGGGATAGDVQSSSVLAQLQHLAGYENTAASGGARGEGADHGAQSFGVGVVAVVQNRGPSDFHDLAALVTRSECGDRSGGRV